MVLQLKRLVIHDFKSYEKTHILEFERFTCIIGANGSGKSNILDSFLFCFGFNLSKLRYFDGERRAYVECQLVACEDSVKKVAMKYDFIKFEKTFNDQTFPTKTNDFLEINKMVKQNISNDKHFENCHINLEKLQSTCINAKERNQNSDNIPFSENRNNQQAEQILQYSDDKSISSFTRENKLVESNNLENPVGIKKLKKVQIKIGEKYFESKKQFFNISFRREMRNGKSFYSVNQINVNKTVYLDILCLCGIDTSKFLVQQGEIELISLKKPMIMLEYIEKTIGSDYLIPLIQKSEMDVSLLSEDKNSRDATYAFYKKEYEIAMEELSTVNQKCILNSKILLQNLDSCLRYILALKNNKMHNDQVIDELKQEIEKIRNENKDKQLLYKTQEKDFFEDEKQLRKMEKSIGDFQSRIYKDEREISQLEEKVGKIRKNITRLEKIIEQKKESNAMVESELNNAKNEYEKIQSELKSYDESISDINKILSDLGQISLPNLKEEIKKLGLNQINEKIEQIKINGFNCADSEKFFSLDIEKNVDLYNFQYESVYMTFDEISKSTKNLQQYSKSTEDKKFIMKFHLSQKDVFSINYFHFLSAKMFIEKQKIFSNKMTKLINDFEIHIAENLKELSLEQQITNLGHIIQMFLFLERDFEPNFMEIEKRIQVMDDNIQILKNHKIQIKSTQKEISDFLQVIMSKFCILKESSSLNVSRSNDQIKENLLENYVSRYLAIFFRNLETPDEIYESITNDLGGFVQVIRDFLFSFGALLSKGIQITSDTIQRINHLKNSQIQNNLNTKLSNTLKDIPGYIGRIGDLCATSPLFAISVVSSAKSFLNHHLVENTKVAEICIEKIKTISRVSFLCIDRIDKSVSNDKIVWVHKLQSFYRSEKAQINDYDEIQIEKPDFSDFLIKYIDFDEKLTKIFYFIFNDTRVCRDLSLAKKISFESVRKRVVTIQGEVIEKSGLMCGKRLINPNGLIKISKSNSELNENEFLKSFQTKCVSHKELILRNFDSLISSIKTMDDKNYFFRTLFEICTDKNNEKDRIKNLEIIFGIDRAIKEFDLINSLVDPKISELEIFSQNLCTIKQSNENLQDFLRNKYSSLETRNKRYKWLASGYSKNINTIQSCLMSVKNCFISFNQQISGQKSDFSKSILSTILNISVQPIAAFLKNDHANTFLETSKVQEHENKKEAFYIPSKKTLTAILKNQEKHIRISDLYNISSNDLLIELFECIDTENLSCFKTFYELFQGFKNSLIHLQTTIFEKYEDSEPIEIKQKKSELETIQEKRQYLMKRSISLTSKIQTSIVEDLKYYISDLHSQKQQLHQMRYSFIQKADFENIEDDSEVFKELESKINQLKTNLKNLKQEYDENNDEYKSLKKIHKKVTNDLNSSKKALNELMCCQIEKNEKIKDIKSKSDLFSRRIESTNEMYGSYKAQLNILLETILKIEKEFLAKDFEDSVQKKLTENSNLLENKVPIENNIPLENNDNILLVDENTPLTNRNGLKSTQDPIDLCNLSQNIPNKDLDVLNTTSSNPKPQENHMETLKKRKIDNIDSSCSRSQSTLQFVDDLRRKMEDFDIRFLQKVIIDENDNHLVNNENPVDSESINKKSCSDTKNKLSDFSQENGLVLNDKNIKCDVKINTEVILDLKIKKIYIEDDYTPNYKKIEDFDQKSIEDHISKKKEYEMQHHEYLNFCKNLQREKETLKQHKEKRNVLFTKGLDTINSNLKNIYQCITNGGQAELEPLEYDPYQGIVLSVRPPKKSWKKLEILSGGEKTMASVALVLAIHQYRPSPFYLLDEIDAALDYKNTCIIAEYLKKSVTDTSFNNGILPWLKYQQNNNASQFIIVSLRKGFIEQADTLIGVYKTDSSKTAIFRMKELKKSLKEF